jgi:hypothetical protein
MWAEFTPPDCLEQSLFAVIPRVRAGFFAGTLEKATKWDLCGDDRVGSERVMRPNQRAPARPLLSSLTAFF